MKTICAHTLGCKVNQFDTQAMLEQFERAGYQSVPFGSAADVCIVNTCTVTHTGENKSLQTIRRVHRDFPNTQIIAAGCLSQISPALTALPGVKLVIGNAKRSEAYALFERAQFEAGALVAVGSLREARFETLTVARHEGHTRAVMKIQEGCDRYCAYCVIPFARGPVCSMPLADVRAQAERLAEAGYAELVLTGIHLASYGRDTGDDLLSAIDAVCGVPGVKRVRLGSLEPVIVTEAFARALAERGKLQRQFHLSLQSGSDGVLTRMKRRYTAREYEASARLLQASMPDCALTTDVLTGFPGETEAEAEQTLEFAERIGFARIHVFPYSPREGTLAAKMPDQVEEPVKRARAEKLIALGNRLEAAFVQGLVGTVQEVLFEEEAPEGAQGYTGQYVRVRADARPGEVAPVRIESAKGALAVGRRVSRGEDGSHE